MEHACKLMHPDNFSEFRSKDSGRARLILGKRKGSTEWEVQAIRYPKEGWAESTARASCEAHEGMFEAAVKVAEHAMKGEIPVWPEGETLPSAAVAIFAEFTREERTYAKRLRGVEIFSAGKGNGDTYSESDLDGMVSAFYALGPSGTGEVVPPLKLGHSEAQRFFGQADGVPALGWVEGPRRNGGKMVSDFADVPDVLHELFRGRKYRKVSAEVYWNYKDTEGRIYPRVLKAVSLLGAEIPAVSNLKDLQTALMGERGREARNYDQQGVVVRTYELDLKDSTTKGGSDMDERQYTEKIAALETQLGTEKASRETWETRALRSEATLSQRDEDFAVKQFREVTIPQLKKDGKVLPAEEETLVVTFTSMQAGTRKYAGADVNPREMFVKSLSDRKAQVNLRDSATGGEDDLVRDGETPAGAVDRTIRKFMDTKEAKDYTDGKELVKTRFPQLWERYIRT